MTSFDIQHDSPLPWLVDSRFELHVTGRWGDGGLVEIRFAEKFSVTRMLSVSEWGVLAILVKAALAAANSHWAVSFVTASTLAREFKRRAHRGSGKAEDVHRVIHRLRKQLDATYAGKFQPSVDPNISWAKLLIEKDAKLGYRISLSPGQLHLTDLDELMAP
jgi:hypothetical protein